MNPRLAAIAGPLKGETFPLTEAEFSIGRAVDNQLCLSDPKISRNHCLIRKEGIALRIKDLASHNCTFVNAVPVSEKLLEHGDRIGLGGSQFVFLIHEDIPVAFAPTVTLDESELRAGATVSLTIADALYLQPARPEALAPTAATWARDLNALLKISMAVNSIRGLEALELRLLEQIFEVIPAERGAIIIVEENSDQFASVFGMDRLAGPAQPVQVSRTIVRRVLREGAAILHNDILKNEAVSTSESLIVSRIESLLCVPLVVFDNTLGVIYLDTRDRTAPFEERHLQLMTAIAAITAVAVRNVMHVEWLQSENQRLQADIDIEHDMVGESPGLRDVFQFIAKVAPINSTVLITGESGTGKELVARAIHRNSPRAAKPFVAINCATLTETLLESELFGHERGAFTGAVAQKKGKLEVADGGTVFLDEMGELALAIQAKLLRVLQEQEFERVGSTRPIKVNIRLIAATNRNLEEALRTGAFRKDLYYRLNVVSLKMAPLRERREDIPLLAAYFAEKYAEKSKRHVRGISSHAQACMLAYDWPGNVRELENAIERAVVLGSTDHILPEDLPEAVLEAQPSPPAFSVKYHEAVRESKRQIVRRALDQAGEDYTEAAKSLGLHVNNLHRLIRNLDLKQAMKKTR